MLSEFKIRKQAVILVNMYVPKTTGTHSLRAISKLAGGCTILKGAGEWQDENGDWVFEEVIKYEWVFPSLFGNIDRLELLTNLTTVGTEFLRENPTEKEVLFTIDSGGVVNSLRITRKSNLAPELTLVPKGVYSD